MSGHSKFHNIKARKGAQDAKRGQIFTKIAREIMVAVKEGGPSPDTNIKLKMAIQKGRDNSMPNDTIQSAIKRASGAQEGANYEEIVYEGYAPGGVALLVECLTDNRNRTVSEVKTAFSKHNGNLGTTGSVSYLFDRKGQLLIAKEGVDEDQIMEIALEAGAEDIKTEDEEAIEVITDPADYVAVREAFEKAGISFINAEITKIPQTTNLISDAKVAKQILKIIDKLEECDDVQKVYSNYEIDESIEDEVNE
ncbi:MAG: YebC/PmpR family DNA-binding transcriptional regulator [Abditibacteriota bacterium]|nr:YebC/PmpR family DNA-binding transcriptional regulator [Abditibacteriota bacterium]